MAEAYSDAHRELQLAEAEFKVHVRQVGLKPDLRLEVTKAQVRIEAAKRKLDLFKLIAEAEINSTEEEMKVLTEQLSTAVSGQVERLKRQMREQQLRLDILKNLISR